MSQNDFQPWAPAAPDANLTPLTLWPSSATRLAGAISGVADPLSFNRGLRQASIISTMIAQFIAAQAGTDVIDDGSTALILQNFMAAIQNYGRIKLTTQLDLYVSNGTGSGQIVGNDNTNNGRSASTPFATHQAAFNSIMQDYDMAGWNAVVHTAPGTYNTGLNVYGVPVGYGGSNNILFTGDIVTPSNCAFVVSNGHCVQAYAPVSLSGFQFTSTGTDGSGSPASSLVSNLGSIYVTGPCDFHTATGFHMWATGQGQITSSANYRISGNAQCHFRSDASALINILAGTTTVSSGLTFSQFASCALNSTIQLLGNPTYSTTTATGQRYFTSQNGIISTNGVVFPGSTAGSGSGYS